MGAYKYIRKVWKKPSKDVRAKSKLWARQAVVKRIERPTRLDRARSLGYKSKQGFVLARTRIAKGRRRRHSPTKGRKPHAMGIFFTPKQSLQAIAERRVARKFPNLEVLNSYHVGEDGKHNYYEVILIDMHHASAQKDKDLGIAGQRKRVFRGLTSASRKGRLNKGHRRA